MNKSISLVSLMTILMLAACGKEAEQAAPAPSAAPATPAPAAAATEEQAESADAAAEAPAEAEAGAVPASGGLAESIARGEKLYATHCIVCHQANGQGMAGAFPPLANSDYIAGGSRTVVIETILKGLSGPITVNGTDYNSVMPPMTYINDADAADIANFVMNSWDNPGGEFTAADAAEVRAR